MPVNLKRFANGRRGGLLAAIIVSSIVLGLFGLMLVGLLVAVPYEAHTPKMAVFFVAMAGLAGLIWALLVSSRHAAQTRFTCGLYGPEQLAAIDAEVAAGGSYYKALGVVVTATCLLSHGAGLVIVPLGDIVNITCRTCGGKARLVLRSHNGGETLLPRFQWNSAARAELRNLTGFLAARLPELTAGTQNTPAAGQPCDMLPGFLAADTSVGIQMQPDVQGPGSEAQKPDYGKGALGAVLGAMLGCTLWGLVGLAGYMSGWIGLLVVALALYGFKQVAGRLDKTAGWICLVVSLIMLFPANYLVYSAAVADALADYYYVTVFDVLPQLFPTLAEIELLGQFWGEYAIGAGLTFVFGLIEISSFAKSRRCPGGVTAPVGVPAGQGAAYGVPAQSTAFAAAPAAGQNAEQAGAASPYGAALQSAAPYGAQADAPARFEVRFPRGKTNGTATFIVLLIVAVLMFAIGLIAGGGLMLGGEMAAGLSLLIIFCAMGGLYLWLGIFTRNRIRRFCITYDTVGLHVTKINGKSFSCPWGEVTALCFSTSAMLWTGYQIVTPYGKASFNGQMLGWDHLMAFARTYAVNARQ
ncbi:MAG: hypothetical protein LKJ90_06235 [Faecalibacterium sp.]|nr:hypothetical protein [Faecalibacterium sp.]